MNSPDVSAGQWKVDIRPSGEILTASATEASIELGLLGIPGGYSPAEIEGWLHDLIGVARETGREDAQPRPIPALLHHGLTGLLFSHAQLWNREGERHPASYAIVSHGGAVAFGWVGDASVATDVNGQRVDPGEIIVRDDEGREARAFELPDGEDVTIRLEWAGGAEGEAPVVLEARWAGAASAPAAPVGRVVIAEPPSRAEPIVQEAPARSAAPPPSPSNAAEPDAPEEALEEEAFEFEPEMPSLRDEIELPAAPRLAPEQPVARMEGIVRDAVRIPGTGESFLESSSEPLDLSAGPQAPFAQTRAEATDPEREPVVDAVAPESDPSGEEDEADAAESELRAGIASESQSFPAAATEQLAIETPVATGTLDEDLYDDAPPEAFDEPAEPGERPSRLRRMFSRFAFWRRDDAEAGDDTGGTDAIDEAMAHDVPGVPDQVPPSPESAEITERAVQTYAPSAPSDLELETSVEAAVPEARLEQAARDDRDRNDAPQAVEVDRTPHAAMAEPVAETAPEIPPLAAAPFESPAPIASAVIEPHVVDPQSPSEAAAPQQPIAAATDPVAARTPLRPQWPSADEMKPPAPLWKRPWVWAVVMAGLFAGGWIVGHMNDERREGAARGMRDVLRTVGLGGAHFEVMINSKPPGAWISLDGQDLARRTPASVEMKPGEHEVTLSFSDLGAATYKVRGADGDRLALEPALWGSINVYSSDEEVPVAVSVDGVPRGFAPLRADSLAPGAHDVRFSGPGLPSWGQTVQVRVAESSDLIARPMTSPATGVIEVRASLTTETGTVDVEGARVYLDGEPAGKTPLTLELPRGPHSIRVEHLGETAPVQVIDLPGGNQRFASFQLRPASDLPSLATVNPPSTIPLDQPTVISAALDGVQTSELREMWLHVQMPDGPWRRYQMAWLKAPGGVVGVAVFPTTLFGQDGRARYYTSASTQAGDEYYSEVGEVARPDAPRARKR